MSHPPNPLRRRVEAGALILGCTSLATASLVAGGRAYAGEQDDNGSNHVSVAAQWRNDPQQRSADTTSQSSTTPAAGSTAITSDVSTFVTAGDAGDDDGTNRALGGLLVAGGLITFVAGLIASRRRKATKPGTRLVENTRLRSIAGETCPPEGGGKFPQQR